MPAYQTFNFSTVGLSDNASLRYCGSEYLFSSPFFSGMGLGRIILLFSRRNEWTELYQIWVGHWPIIGASKFILDF